MPWAPERFTVPALQRILEQRRRTELVAVPYFDGIIAGEPDALIESFAGVPVLHDPVRGRIQGAAALRAFAEQMRTWLVGRDVTVEDVDRVLLEGRSFEDVVVHLDGAAGRVDLPVAIVADHRSGGLIDELRVYHSGQALTGRHTHRPPMLQPDPDLREPDVVAEYHRALAAGDVDGVVAAFEPDGYVCESASARDIHRGPADLRALHERLFSNGGGIAIEKCALVDDGRACALEYNIVRWGRTELSPQAGAAVYVRGASGRLAAARAYDDPDTPSSAA
jgi:hypothetical protein